MRAARRPYTPAMPKSPWLQAPTALGYFQALVADDATLPLTEAALALAQDEHPQLDVQAALAEIDGVGARLRRRLPRDASSLHRLRLLNHFFFQELGFALNPNDYYDPDNSFLHRVLATRRGIPISLAVLYLELAQQAGLRAFGVSFPGHFLVKLRVQGGGQSGEVVIDPADGRSLSREDLEERLQPYKRRHGLLGDFDIPLGLFLQAATPREVLARMLRNLKEIHRSAADWPRLHAVTERLVLLLPDLPEERRDRALVRAELGLHEEAVGDLAHYLAERPDAPDREALGHRLAAWRAAGPRRLH